VTYQGWMALSQTQWLKYNDFWTAGLKDDLSKNVITKTQYDEIWKQRIKLTTNLRDSKGKVAAIDPTIKKDTNIVAEVTNTLTGAYSDLAKDVKTGVGNVTGAVSNVVNSSTYIVLGVVGILILILFGRR
jgi:hypothetical protein